MSRAITSGSGAASADGDPPFAAVDRCAARWAAALAGDGVPESPSTAVELRPLVVRLARVVAADRSDDALAHDICAVLVRGGRPSAAARFRALFSQAAAGIGNISMSGLVVDGNDTWARQMGYPIEEMRGRALRDLFVPGTEPLALMRFLELLEGVRDSFRLELTHVRRDGRRYVLDLSMSRVHVDDAEPDFLVGIALDVTDRKRFEEKLWHEARHDPLTGLPNRTMFFERLRAALGGPDRSAPVGLCHVDLDGFKSVNDGLGHDVGDRLLVRVADRLREALTAPGTLLARLGGDEFGVVVDGTHGATAAEQAQLVLEVLAAPFTIDRHELALSASVGVADSTAVGADGRELMRAADVGLYRAKARGRGRVEVHDPRGDAQRVTHHVLATEMAAALAHGELFLEYQPLVTLADDTTRPGASRRCRGGVTPGSASSRRTGSSSWRRRPATPARSAGGC